MKQTELAQELGVTNGLISQWENGRTRVMADDLARIAHALKMELEDLLSPLSGASLLEVGVPGAANKSGSAGSAREEIEIGMKRLRIIQHLEARENRRRLLLALYDDLLPDDQDSVLDAALRAAGWTEADRDAALFGGK